MKKLVTVVIPNYNGRAYIAEAIESCLSQTYEHVQVIVVDDGSTDGSINYLKERYGSKLEIYESQRRGAGAARNIGLMNADGEYLKFLDADDVLLPQAIQLQLDVAETLPQNTITFGNYAVQPENGRRSSFKNHILLDGGFPSLIHHDILITTPLHRTETLRLCGGFDARIRRGQEWNLHVRLAMAGVVFVHHPVDVFVYRDLRNATKISRVNSDPLKAYSQVCRNIRYTFPLEALESDQVREEVSKYLVSCSLRSFRAGKLKIAVAYLKRAMKVRRCML